MKEFKINKKGDGSSWSFTTLGKWLLILLAFIFLATLLGILFKDRIMPFLGKVFSGFKGLLFSK
jgi:hypothetical protein